MNLFIGDKIYVTDELLEGKLLSFTDNSVTIECPDGFEYTFAKEKVYKLGSDGNAESQPRREGSITGLKHKKTVQPSGGIELNFNTKNTVVDLHLEALVSVNDVAHYSYTEALALQVRVVREVIREANRQRIRKFVFVHGVGKGKLRMEIRNLLLDSYPEIEFLDGNYQKFGAGATELIIHQFD